MIKRLVFVLAYMPFIALGQYHITGRVVDSATKKPVTYTAVFLNNASAGTKTNDDGTFDIANVHSGYYDLVISLMGYKTFRQTVNVSNNVSLPDIQIAPRSIALKEVSIGPDKDWDRNYKLFKNDFLGSAGNADKCKILNPEVISLHFDDDKQELTASSYDFIVIENKALGYRIKYLLADFSRSYSLGKSNELYYEGSSHFEDLSGSKRDMERWKKARLEAYLESDAHFLRAVIANNVVDEGFLVRRLIRDTDKTVPGKIKMKPQILVTTLLNVTEYAARTEKSGLYVLSFKNCLAIKNNPKAGFFTDAILTFKEPYTFFDNNGIIINPRSVILEGTWAHMRIADMLPDDYALPVK